MDNSANLHSENLFLSTQGSSQSSSDSKADFKVKREHYTIEIRNRARESIFAAKRQQIMEHEEQCQQTQSEMQQLPAWLNSFLQGPQEREQIMQALKRAMQTDVTVYTYIWNDRLGAAFFLELVKQLASPNSPTYTNLLAYHINNMIFFSEGRYLQVVPLPALIDQLLVVMESSVKQGYMSNAAHCLYGLANVYGEENIYENQQIKGFHSELTGRLLQSVERASIGKDHILFCNGICWLLRNLAYQNASYGEFGMKALRCIEVMWPDIEKYISRGDKGCQIADDALLIIRLVANTANDDILSDFFSEHVSLMVGIVTFKWPESEIPNVLKVFKNITAGQDDVLEQLLELGLLDLFSRILEIKHLATNPDFVAVLGNYFCTVDDVLIEKVLAGLGQDRIVALLLYCLEQTKDEAKEYSLAALNNLVRNYPCVVDQLLQRNLIQLTLHCLKDSPDKDGLDVLEALLELQEGDMEVENCNAKQIIIANGGLEIINLLCHSKSDEQAELAQKVYQTLTN